MKNRLLKFLLLSSVIWQLSALAQPERWQQHIKYSILVNMDIVTNRFTGIEKLEYTNNSPDTLNRVFFHLYWNAFQPNSSMDVRNRELGKIIFTNKKGEEVPDWDDHVKDRIYNLNEKEIGYDSVGYIKVNGKEQKLIYHETILEVQLDKPLAPHSTVLMEVSFKAQVPVQIRRSGHDNAEGIRYSMGQWYPKMVEYDYQGWNANPYIAREFYGVWGDYDVNITIDKHYMVAATGVLQNANQIGYGFAPGITKAYPVKGNTLQWNFKGENIHDFVWAADPQYKHLSKKVRNGLILNVFYKAGDAKYDSAWRNVLWAAEQVLPFMEKKFGKYPWPQYSFIQGGDGGMEYAMAALVKGSGLGTIFHEWMHSWYQQMMGSNESLYPWMDEGFTTYAEGEITAYYNDSCMMRTPFINAEDKLSSKIYLDGRKDRLPLNQADSYIGYFGLAKSGLEEPMSTHADHYNTNYAYGNAAYSKGAVFMKQLEYIVGTKTLGKILLEYYNEWRFKHPNANDFIRVAEKVSGLALQWYKEYWIYSTKTIDYAIGNINPVNGNSEITLKRLGKMPMPIEVLLTFKNGTKELHYIPLNLMYGNKLAEDTLTRIVHAEWKWTDPEYIFVSSRSIKDIKTIEIDPSQRMADVNRINNKLIIPD